MLEWLESFKVVVANEECNGRHLEIVCKFGHVPPTGDIVDILGKEILPFITYKECTAFLLFQLTYKWILGNLNMQLPVLYTCKSSSHVIWI